MNLLKSNSRGRLAEVLGHELRNPLASAMASVSVSLEMSDAGDPRSTFLSRALDDLARASTILTSYLDFGRRGAMNLLEPAVYCCIDRLIPKLSRRRSVMGIRTQISDSRST